MYSLSYRTKNGRYPGNKPRVLLCGHAEDSGLFETITDHILAQADCAVWVLEGEPDNECEWEGLKEDLVEIQAAVVPFTLRFLTDNSFASQTLVPFLLQEEKHLIPLVMEPGCDLVFRERFGDLHYFSVSDLFSDWGSADRKLSLYLNSLFHNSARDKIDSAFRSRIFLSYRKKDRALARRLMKQLHDDIRFEDMAVWYDEYLYPGEDFNDEIEDYIRKCDVFLLLVTPNLLEEGNYVLRREYPFAISQEKQILPCIVESTDLDLLNRLYGSLPNPVELPDMNSALAVLRNNCRQSIEKNPQEIFYLGYAYLLGIEVEVDMARGRRLVSQAAKEGYEDAMLQMAIETQYQPNLENPSEDTVFWRKRLIESAKKRATESEDPMAIRKVISQNLDLGTCYREKGNYELALHHTIESEEYVKRFQKILGHDEFVNFTLQIEKTIATLSEITGDLPGCASKCKSIIKTVEEIDDSEKSYPVMRQAMLAKCQLGDVFFKSKNFDSARSCYQDVYADAIACYDDLRENRLKLPPDTEETESSGHPGGDVSLFALDMTDQTSYMVQKDLAVARTKLGDVDLESGKIDEALLAYSEAERHLNDIMKMGLQSITLRREIGLLHRKKSDVYSEQYNFSLALQEIQRAIQIGEEILAIASTQQFITDVAVYYYQKGNIQKHMRKIFQARNSYRKAIDYLNALQETPFSISFRKMIHKENPLLL